MEKVGLYEEEKEKREVESHPVDGSYAGVDKMLLGATGAIRFSVRRR